MSTVPTHAAGLEFLRDGLAERLARGLVEVPMLPQTASRVLTLCNEATCDARKLAELIQHDAGLAGHVLSVANSAAYAPREPIVSLSQAISRLGFRIICEIAVAVAVKGKVFAVRGREELARQLWTHSAMAGAWAKEIARARRRNVEGAFLCGLLHDIGKPATLQTILEMCAARSLAVEATDADQVMHEFHERVGAHVLESWTFPAWMSAAVLHHHDPDRAGEHVEWARTTQLADLLAHASTRADALTDDVLRRHPVFADLDLYVDEMDALFARRELVVEVARAFQ